MIYLASPYSHPDTATREARYAAACRATATLIAQGCAVFSPIVHSHPLAGYNLPAEWEFWQRLDREYLRRCDDLFVLMLDGWQESSGVRAEIELAEEFQLSVYYLSETMISNMSGGVTSIPKRQKLRPQRQVNRLHIGDGLNDLGPSEWRI